MPTAAVPFRPLSSDGVRNNPPGGLMKRAMKGGMKQTPPITRDNGMGPAGSGNTNATNDGSNWSGGAGWADRYESGAADAPTPASANSPAKPSLMKKAPPTTALANGRFPVSAYAGTPPAAGAQPVQQKETASPLTGDPANVPTGASQDIAAPGPALPGMNGKASRLTEPLLPANELATARPFAPKPDAGKALGFNQRGSGTPMGDDALPAAGNEPTADNGQTPGGNAGSFPGGTGPMQRNFSNPTSAAVYHDYTKNLFGGANQTPAARAGKSLLTRAPATRGAEDQQTEDAGEDQA